MALPLVRIKLYDVPDVEGCVRGIRYCRRCVVHLRHEQILTLRSSQHRLGQR